MSSSYRKYWVELIVIFLKLETSRKWRDELTFVHKRTSQQLPSYLDNFRGMRMRSSLQIFGIVQEKVILTFEVLSLSLCEINFYDLLITIGNLPFKKSISRLASF